MDPYTDKVLGEWHFDKKATTKDTLCYERRATMTLHKDHAQPYVDPESFKSQRVHGEVILIERKQINKQNSATVMFRAIELTPRTKVEDPIP